MSRPIKKMGDDLLADPILFRELMDRANDNLSIIDLNTGRFLYVNEMACLSTGYTPNEFRKMTVADIDPTVTTRWDADEERRKRKKVSVFVREGMIKRKDGICIPVEISSSIVRIDGRDYMVATSHDITTRKQLMELVSSERDGLKQDVRKKVAELAQVNISLKVRIAAHARAEKALKVSEAKLLKQRSVLDRKNIALSELLKEFAKEKVNTTENIAANIDVVMIPLLDRMRREGVSPAYIAVLKDQIKNLASKFGVTITDKDKKLTAREIEIAAMLKSGLSSKQISDHLNISRGSADWHRNNIRKKLGIVGEKHSLRSVLAKL